MKLFAFQPQGHGELSFFVMAETEQEAIEAIDKEIVDNPQIIERDINGWKTDYYRLTVCERGQVIVNDNE